MLKVIEFREGRVVEKRRVSDGVVLTVGKNF